MKGGGGGAGLLVTLRSGGSTVVAIVPEGTVGQDEVVTEVRERVRPSRGISLLFSIG